RYDPLTSTGPFVPAVALPPGSPYVVSLGPVRDIAGSLAQPISSWTVTPLRPTSLAISISSALVTIGASVDITGTSTGLDGEDVLLSIRQGGSTTATEIGPFVPSGGRLTASQSPAMNTWYRWQYPGSPTSAPAVSPEFRVLVRRGVSLLGVSSTSSRT